MLAADTAADTAAAAAAADAAVAAAAAAAAASTTTALACFPFLSQFVLDQWYDNFFTGYLMCTYMSYIGFLYCRSSSLLLHPAINAAEGVSPGLF